MPAKNWTYGLAAFAALVLLYTVAAQSPPPAPAAPPPGAPVPPQQLDDLVAPIALYPDPLLGEILAAATYPMEIAEAEQWLHDHPRWKPEKLMKEAKKQNWDPSVQGLVAFPDVLDRFSQDIGWTTQLGNAFLAQQADVMQAVQRMRAQAMAKGVLRSNPQETVTTQNENGQSVIDIQPANPDVWDVPNYNPAYVWGPPAWGDYPPLFYPGIGLGMGWFPGIDIGLYWGDWGGWGWGGWGWTPDWFGGDIFLNHSFFNRYGFNYGFGGDRLGRSVWAHNPEHRLGVPYANREVANRFGQNGGSRGETGRAFGGQGGRSTFRATPGGRFGTPGFEKRGWTGGHSAFGGYHNGGMTRMQSDRGFSSMGGRAGGFGGGFHGGGGGFHGGGGGRR
ncbi:MAG: DUF3300 domain-containing protein [Bryobacteraceae bacterium]